MTTKTIDALPAASSLTGSEEVPVWQGGATKKTTAGDIAGLAVGGSLLTATVTLTSAQILSSFTSPVEAIPGVAGKTIFVIGAAFKYNHVTTDYTSGDNLGLVYHGETSLGGGATLASSPNTWNAFSATQDWAQSPNNYPGFSSITGPLVGLGVDFVTNNANPTGGDSTMTITVWYVTF